MEIQPEFDQQEKGCLGLGRGGVCGNVCQGRTTVRLYVQSYVVRTFRFARMTYVRLRAANGQWPRDVLSSGCFPPEVRRTVETTTMDVSSVRFSLQNPRRLLRNRFYK